MMRNLISALFLLVSIGIMDAQPCELRLEGKAIDVATGEPLEWANIYIEELMTGVVSDSTGHFSVSDLCPGAYHLRVSHVGCGPVKVFLSLKADTTIQVELHHHSELLQSVHVHDQRNTFGRGQVRSVISEKEIINAASSSIAEIAAALPGVSTLSTGPGISKPVIHGLYGQRIALVQDGLNLAGQRWGNDHAPEVAADIFSSIEVVKGVSALAYGAEGLGGAVVMHSGSIDRDPHLHSRIRCAWGSNSSRSSLTARVQKWEGSWGWRLHAGGNIRGDYKTPDYFLSNTAGQQAYGGADAEIDHSDNWLTKLNYRYFYDHSGVLRGSHLNTIEALESAFTRSEPYFTLSERTWQPESPRQRVVHHTLGLKSTLQLQDAIRLNFNYGAQINTREEFDIRRGGRSNIPALDLALQNHQAALDIIRERSSWTTQLGVQLNWSQNANDASTGISPLIPDYRSLNSGLFTTIKYAQGRLELEAGARYDHKYLSVAIAPGQTGGDIERFRHRFNNLTASLGGTYRMGQQINLQVSSGFVQRQPYINELYSNGLHQGVAGIEEGNRNLSPELGIKHVIGCSWHTASHWLIEGRVFHHSIRDFIYLAPTGESRLTIRGTFPVFAYEQRDARLMGTDLSFQFPIGHNLSTRMKGSFLDGRNVEQDEALIYMPQNEVSLDLTYDFTVQRNGGSVTFGGIYVFEQNKYPEEQVIIRPPEAYFLLNLSSHYDFSLAGLEWTLTLAIDNMLNRRYRNYLNRNRYFSDEPGRNMKVGVVCAF